MTDTPRSDDGPQDEPQRRLDGVTEQVETMQALLVRLLQDVVRAEGRLAGAPDPTLVEVNQRLVVAALDSRAEADAARLALQNAEHSALLDALTGLPNRNALRDRFTRDAAHARRQGSHCALLFIDLDDFKKINDSLGHDTGDSVLKLVADRLSATVREVDTVSRYGGDEFAVLLAGLARPEDVQPVVDKLAAAIAAPFKVDGHPLAMTASIGIAVFPDDGDEINTLIACADTAMYASKRQHQALAPKPVAGALRYLRREPAREELPRHLADLREANAKLVLSALDARRLAEAAQQARDRQSALLAAVVEELRDPMAPIRIATAMLGRPFADEPLLPRVEHIVAQQLQHISAIVEAVGIEEGHRELHLQRQRVDAAQAIDAAVLALRPLTEASSQQVDWQRPAQPVEVMGDAAGLEQVVANLIDNASCHTRTGGHIALALALGEGRMTLTVSDDGIGITPALLPIIFEPFVQDARTLGADGIGRGVGLAVARALAHAQGGEITAHSAGHERGSAFVLTLPLARAPNADAAAEPA